MYEIHESVRMYFGPNLRCQTLKVSDLKGSDLKVSELKGSDLKVSDPQVSELESVRI